MSNDFTFDLGFSFGSSPVTGVDLWSTRPARPLHSNPITGLGWINYYGRFYRSTLYSLAARIDEHLVRWAMQKYKRLRGHRQRAWAWLNAVRQRQPALFAHWQIAHTNHRPVGAG